MEKGHEFSVICSQAPCTVEGYRGLVVSFICHLSSHIVRELFAVVRRSMYYAAPVEQVCFVSLSHKYSGYRTGDPGTGYRRFTEMLGEFPAFSCANEGLLINHRCAFIATTSSTNTVSLSIE
jgi:hypothetical protein